MRFEEFSFGCLKVDGKVLDYDVVIDRGTIRKRKKRASKRFRDKYGHTPLSVEEDIPWKCRHLVVGTGVNGALSVMDEVKCEAERRNVSLLILPTPKAIELLKDDMKETNAVLHVTC